MLVDSSHLLGLGIDTILVSGTADSLSLSVAIEQDVTLILDELTFVVVLPQGLEGGHIGGVVMVTDESLEVLGSLGSVIERHLGEEVVNDVEVSDVVEEEAPLPAKDRPINSSGGTALEVPLLSAVVGHDGVGVVEISDHDEPVRNSKPWDAVVLDSVSGTKAVAGVSNAPDHSSDTNVAQNNGIALGLGEEDRVGIEVVGPFRVGLLARDVEEKVRRESEDLLTDQHEQGINGGIAQDFVIVKTRFTFLRKTEIGTGLGNINFVALHRRMVAVVAVVRDLPAEVRSPEEGVGDEANYVVNPFVIRESTMTTLVADNPNTRENKALEPPISTPSSPAPELSTDRAKKFLGRCILEGWVNIRRKGPGGSCQRDVPGKELQATLSVADKETVRNGSPNLFQRPRHRCEGREVVFIVLLDVR